MRSLLLALTLLAGSALGLAHGADQAPLKALFVVGGGYHDYKGLTPLLTEGMAKYANVAFTIQWINNEQELSFLANPKLGADHDVIVYDMCYADFKDQPTIQNAIRVTKEGKPTVMVHCAMHCFWSGDDWAGCCGLVTKSHDGFRGFATTKAEPEHPIVKSFPKDWSTPGDELYRNVKFPETSVPLLKAFSTESKVDHVVAWVHQFGKGRVFATSLGHDTKTAAQADYLRLLANGLLWTCGKLGEDGKPVKGFAGPEAK